MTSNSPRASPISYGAACPTRSYSNSRSQHHLRDPEVLHAQIHRMLLDPKSRALVENFAGQWLQIRNLDSLQPDPAKFPQFDTELRRDMLQETQLFFQSIIRDDRPVADFIGSQLHVPE